MCAHDRVASGNCRWLLATVKSGPRRRTHTHTDTHTHTLTRARTRTHAQRRRTQKRARAHGGTHLLALHGRMPWSPGGSTGGVVGGAVDRRVYVAKDAIATRLKGRTARSATRHCGNSTASFWNFSGCLLRCADTGDTATRWRSECQHLVAWHCCSKLGAHTS